MDINIDKADLPFRCPCRSDCNSCTAIGSDVNTCPTSKFKNEGSFEIIWDVYEKCPILVDGSINITLL